jgi:hypothetical protein
MTPVCVNCEVMLVCAGNGIAVGSEANPIWVKNGDLYRCPRCGIEVITGLGEGYEGKADLVLK